MRGDFEQEFGGAGGLAAALLPVLQGSKLPANPSDIGEVIESQSARWCGFASAD